MEWVFVGSSRRPRVRSVSRLLRRALGPWRAARGCLVRREELWPDFLHTYRCLSFRHRTLALTSAPPCLRASVPPRILRRAQPSRFAASLQLPPCSPVSSAPPTRRETTPSIEEPDEKPALARHSQFSRAPAAHAALSVSAYPPCWREPVHPARHHLIRVCMPTEPRLTC